MHWLIRNIVDRAYDTRSLIKGRSLSHMLQELCWKSERVAVLIATPVHGNLGDHAIVRAEKLFLEEMGFDILEIERIQYERVCKRLHETVDHNVLIVVDGGGNVGTLWPEENDKMNVIVESFSSNAVAIFPQTAFFEDTPAGEECRRGVAAAYGRNPNLMFFSRDRATYDAIRDVSPETPNLYVPDIVLYLNESRDGGARKGALLCLRNDKERVTDGESSTAIRFALTERGLSVRETSTVVDYPYRVDASNRDAVLQAKWDEFRSAEVVITDRLHGMIFSAITGTPCVALDNVSHKVSQGYEWIRHIPNIRVAASADEVPDLLNVVLEAGSCRYNRTPLDPYFDQIKAAIQHAIN